MMPRPLPAWAAAIEPVGMDEAARLLGVCRRSLTSILAQHPYYEARGRGKKVFYPEHIEALRTALKGAP